MFHRIGALSRNFRRATANEDGQGLAEYALILTFVAAACVIALSSLGTAIQGPISTFTAGL